MTLSVRERGSSRTSIMVSERHVASPSRRSSPITSATRGAPGSPTGFARPVRCTCWMRGSFVWVIVSTASRT
jgi:hypothetical protein